MYQEDRFDPTQANEFDSPKELVNKHDKYYFRTTKTVMKREGDNTYSKVLKINYFGSRGQDNFIRHAISGDYYSPEYKVGSGYENLFFKVKVSTGEFGQEPITLFYDTPEQYEMHQHETVSQDIKNMWSEKYMIAKAKYLKV